jgi:sec-independent protein translocase protein TatA
MMTLALFGPWEIVIIGVVAVLIFGRRLPEVGRNLGQSLVEFKKGLSGVKDDVKGSLDDVKSAASDIDKEVKR